MTYNFDKIVDRKNTDSLKYDFAKHNNMPEDILPLWVADMDIPTPDEVITALTDKCNHGIYGYSDSREDYFEALQNWYKTYFKWDIESSWLVKTPGVVFAVATAIRAFTSVGDGVLIQEPVYYPFKNSILENERNVVINQLLYTNGRYEIDFDAFESQIVNEQVKLFILCSPHNPVGRVWTKNELIRMGDICLKHNVLILSDEIHADFTYPNIKHHVFANLKPEFLEHSITCTAPTKTFNLAGIQISNTFIADEKLKKEFKAKINQCGYSQVNIMGIIACKAAYSEGHQWLQELKEYLLENLNFTREFLKNNLPEVKLVEPEGTYLIWLDFSKWLEKHNNTSEQLTDIIVHKSKLWLDHGEMFGAGGEGFQRINIACPKSILEKALNQLLEGLNSSV